MRRLRNVKRRAKERSEGGIWALVSSVWVPWAMQRPLTGVGDENRPWSAPRSPSRPPGQRPWVHVEERRGRTPWIQDETDEILNLR